MVSIFCLVFNHEKYLRDCLEGFVNQKTNFKFEVLIHDDASTDSSPDIIREYEKKYPDIIKPIYQTENQYSKGVKINATYQYPRAKGKYFALCEGDDYWNDNCKLQKQFELMESNPSCSISVHKVERISENGAPLNAFYPIRFQKNGFVKKELFLKHIFCCEDYPFQTSSYFYRREFSPYLLDVKPEFMQGLSFGDIPLLLYLATKGDFIYSDEVMSCYRVQSAGSWNSKFDKTSTKNLDENKKMLTAFNAFTNGKYSEEIDYSIRKKEYWYYLINKNFKMVLSKKYRPFFKQMSYKEKVYILLNYLIGKRKVNGQ